MSKMSKRAMMSIKEFREKGYLQELNRCFLHPLGLAMEVKVDEDGTETFGCIWDERDDPGGIIFDIENSDVDRQIAFDKKKAFIEHERYRRDPVRRRVVGFVLEPVRDLTGWYGTGKSDHGKTNGKTKKDSMSYVEITDDKVISNMKGSLDERRRKLDKAKEDGLKAEIVYNVLRRIVSLAKLSKSDMLDMLKSLPGITPDHIEYFTTAPDPEDYKSYFKDVLFLSIWNIFSK